MKILYPDANLQCETATFRHAGAVLHPDELHSDVRQSPHRIAETLQQLSRQYGFALLKRTPGIERLLNPLVPYFIPAAEEMRAGVPHNDHKTACLFCPAADEHAERTFITTPAAEWTAYQAVAKTDVAVPFRMYDETLKDPHNPWQIRGLLKAYRFRAYYDTGKRDEMGTLITEVQKHLAPIWLVDYQRYIANCIEGILLHGCYFVGQERTPRKTPLYGAVLHS